MDKRKIVRNGVLVAIGLLSSCAASTDSPQHARPVGLTLAAYVDETRSAWSGTQSRPLSTAVWYPAADGVREAPWQVGFFHAGSNAQGAPMAATPAKLPLIVISHGTGGGAATLAWLAETLAANGYIVAAVNHHGNTGAEPAYRLEGFVVWWDRPRDLAALIDKLLADPLLGPRIDPARIGVAGFSLGGYAALATVGARLRYSQWKDYCAAKAGDPNCELPPESRFTMDDARRLVEGNARVRGEIERSGDSFRDPRVKAAFAIAPVLGPALTAASLAAIEVPVRIVVGAQDAMAPADITARPVAAAIPNAQLEILPSVSHYTFLASCDLSGRLLARGICVDPDNVDRNAVHRMVSGEALAFFNRFLPRPPGEEGLR